ncbi:DUF4395 domain-containing protein [bacterium]|nr:DUF4395 domain-containing protein [bacterium]
MGNLICPVSTVRIDAGVVRINAFLTMLLLVTYLAAREPLIVIVLALDFFWRSFLNAPPSPMTRVSNLLAGLIRLPYRATDKAPKVFAARIGFLLTGAASVTHFAFPPAAPWLAGIVAVFAFLESAFNFCAGCFVYAHVALPLTRKLEGSRTDGSG